MSSSGDFQAHKHADKSVISQDADSQRKRWCHATATPHSESQGKILNCYDAVTKYRKWSVVASQWRAVNTRESSFQQNSCLFMQKFALKAIEARVEENRLSQNSFCSCFRRNLINSTRFVKCFVLMISPKSLQMSILHFSVVASICDVTMCYFVSDRMV